MSKVHAENLTPAELRNVQSTRLRAKAYRGHERAVWTRGFATAIGTVARGGDYSAAEIAMRTNGITLRMLIDAGVDAFDMRPIRAALRRRTR